jgi:transcriptional regulator
MLDETKIAKLRELRASGLTPKEIARSLGVHRAEVDTLIRTEAAGAARSNESTLVGC